MPVPATKQIGETLDSAANGPALTHQRSAQPAAWLPAVAINTNTNTQTDTHPPTNIHSIYYEILYKQLQYQP